MTNLIANAHTERVGGLGVIPNTKVSKIRSKPGTRLNISRDPNREIGNLGP